MDRTFRLSQNTAELVDLVRRDRSVDLDSLVSKLIPYGVYRKHPVDVACLFFPNARRDFYIPEMEKRVGRKLSDREVRDVIIADFGYSMKEEFEIEAAYDSGVSRAARVRMESSSWLVTLEDIVARGCSDMEDLPLVDLSSVYEAPNGDLSDEIPDGASPDDFREVWMADIFFCRGAEPKYLDEIGALLEIPESRSYDYILPELYEDDGADAADAGEAGAADAGEADNVGGEDEADTGEADSGTATNERTARVPQMNAGSAMTLHDDFSDGGYANGR